MKDYKKLLLISCILCIIHLSFLPVKAEKLTGTAEQIQWEYDDETKTLTFSGKGRIPDGGSWDDWNAGEEMLWEYKKAEIEHIVINEGITEIGNTTFNIMPNLKNVKLCKSLEVIGVMAFEHASNLESIELPENLKVIESSAFEDCIKLKNIVLPESLEYISDNVFFCCKSLEQVKMPSSLKKIPSSAFSCCSSLKAIEIPESVTTIGAGAFKGCRQLTNVKLPSNLKEIPYRMFDGCTSLTTIKIPKSVTTIGEGAFARTGIKKITLPKNVTYIGKNNVDKNNHYGVFEECTSLKEIVVRSRKVKKVTKYTWNGLQKSAVIRVPKSKKKEYQKLFRKAKLSKKQKVRMIK